MNVMHRIKQLKKQIFGFGFFSVPPVQRDTVYLFHDDTRSPPRHFFQRRGLNDVGVLKRYEYVEFFPQQESVGFVLPQCMLQALEQPPSAIPLGLAQGVMSLARYLRYIRKTVRRSLCFHDDTGT